jgi:hypothetical protein
VAGLRPFARIFREFSRFQPSQHARACPNPRITAPPSPLPMACDPTMIDGEANYSNLMRVLKMTA